MLLREALRVQRGDVIAFVGAGGKTSALFRLADELRREGWRVLMTTTTRIAVDELQRAPYAARLDTTITPTDIRGWLNAHGGVFVYDRIDDAKGRVIGVRPETVAGLVDSVNSDVLLVEADGARRLPLKAPRDHEPVIPADTSLVVPMAGLDALGQPLDSAHVYNVERIQGRYGFPEGGIIIPPWMAVTIRDPELGLRGIPKKARVVVLLNKVKDSPHEWRRARRVAQLVLRSDRVEAVAIGAMQSAGEPVYEVRRRVAAVVLAAGRAARMGRSKVLLPWDGRTVIEAIVSRMILSPVFEVVVVTGHRAGNVARVLKDLPITLIHNPEYLRGEMLSSLQAGLRELPVSIDACLVVMGDQPSLDVRVVAQVIEAYAQGHGDIIVPVYRGERGHPVLFDRRFWPELLALEHGAPRDVVRQHPDAIALVDVGNDSVLRDIDTPDEYRRERYLAGLT